MKARLLVLAAPLFTLSATLPTQASNDLEARSREKALEAIQAFQMSLKAKLIGAIEEGGPEAAITVCKEDAPEIASATAQEKGLEIGRTSLKVRNPDNTPDAWEKTVLEEFEAMNTKIEPGTSLEASTMDGNRFRYMKAIPTQALCTVCHGTNIDPELYARIKALYPEDKAIGFDVGDIRGAFTVTVPVADKP